MQDRCPPSENLWVSSFLRFMHDSLNTPSFRLDLSRFGLLEIEPRCGRTGGPANRRRCIGEQMPGSGAGILSLRLLNGRTHHLTRGRHLTSWGIRRGLHVLKSTHLWRTKWRECAVKKRILLNDGWSPCKYFHHLAKCPLLDCIYPHVSRCSVLSYPLLCYPITLRMSLAPLKGMPIPIMRLIPGGWCPPWIFSSLSSYSLPHSPCRVCRPSGCSGAFRWPRNCWCVAEDRRGEGL